MDRILEDLERQPGFDERTRITFDMPDWTAGIYDDGRWEIVYRIVDNRFVEIVGIKPINA